MLATVEVEIGRVEGHLNQYQALAGGSNSKTLNLVLIAQPNTNQLCTFKNNKLPLQHQLPLPHCLWEVIFIIHIPELHFYIDLLAATIIRCVVVTMKVAVRSFNNIHWQGACLGNIRDGYLSSLLLTSLIEQVQFVFCLKLRSEGNIKILLHYDYIGKRWIFWKLLGKYFTLLRDRETELLCSG